MPFFLAVAPATAEECASASAPLAELVAWAERDTAPAAGESGEPVAIEPGAPVSVALAPMETVAWRWAPERAPAKGTRGAVLQPRIARAGAYRVALDTGLWVDIVGPDGLLPSAGHGHGPPCSGIRKIVDFALEPGAYAVQLSGARLDRARLMIVPR